MAYFRVEIGLIEEETGAGGRGRGGGGGGGGWGGSRRGARTEVVNGV